MEVPLPHNSLPQTVTLVTRPSEHIVVPFKSIQWRLVNYEEPCPRCEPYRTLVGRPTSLGLLSIRISDVSSRDARCRMQPNMYVLVRL